MDVLKLISLPIVDGLNTYTLYQKSVKYYEGDMVQELVPGSAGKNIYLFGRLSGENKSHELQFYSDDTMISDEIINESFGERELVSDRHYLFTGAGEALKFKSTITQVFLFTYTYDQEIGLRRLGF